MKTVNIIKAIFQGVLFGIFFFGVGLVASGLPFFPCVTPGDFVYCQISVMISVAFALITGAIWGWHIISLHLEFDL